MGLKDKDRDAGGSQRQQLRAYHQARAGSEAHRWMTPMLWQCATTLTMVRISAAASFSL